MTRLKIAKMMRAKIENIVKCRPALDIIMRNDLACLCAISSFMLKSAFRKYKHGAKVIQGKFGEWGDHCWVESGKYVYDITATQFEEFFNTKILRVKINGKKYKGLYCGGRKVVLKDMKEWPLEQRPTTSLIKKMNKLFI